MDEVLVLEGCDMNGMTRVTVAFRNVASARRALGKLTTAGNRWRSSGRPEAKIEDFPELLGEPMFKDWAENEWHALDALLTYDWYLDRAPLYD